MELLADRDPEEARRLLSENREILDRLANALLERETLDGEEVDAIVAGRDLPQRSKVVRFALEQRFDHIQIEGELGFGKPDESIRRTRPIPSLN